MAENVKLKDLYGDAKTYSGVDVVYLPDADNENQIKVYTKRTIRQYSLRSFPTFEPIIPDAASGTFINDAAPGAVMEHPNGHYVGLAEDLNVIGGVANPNEDAGTSHSVIEIIITNPATRLLYTYENISSENLKKLPLLTSTILGTATFTVIPGWSKAILNADNEIVSFEHLDDVSNIVFDVKFPTTTFVDDIVNAVMYEASQETKSITVTKNGTSSIVPSKGKSGIAQLNLEVNVASSGGGGGDVTFIDYDGSILYSYSLEESQKFKGLPSLPSHDGLVCQGWNWTLEEIKALNRPVTVGAMYITDDGATRLHIRIATVGRMTVPLYIGQTVANGVSIDWGDGSTAETLSGTGNVNTSHTYAEPGDYVISLMPQGGCKLSFGSGSSSYCVMGSTANNGIVYCNMLQDVSIGKNVTSISNFAFQKCSSLASITIPTGVTSIGNRAFSGCRSIASITIPTSVTSISDYAFQNCSSLASITIPTSVTSISNSAFYSCTSLASITIPTGVTSIGASAFQNCSSLASITIPTSVTSISNSAFYSCTSLASITIPIGVPSISPSAFSYCGSLASITIPTSVTSIGASAFSYCYGMRYYDFSACTAIPSLANKNAFNNIPSDCQMLIPSALYNDWKSATNWATYASKMVSV